MSSSSSSSPLVFIDDIANGQENLPIPFINKLNFQTISKDVCYVPNNILHSISLMDNFESLPLPCSCEDICDISCSCRLGSDIAYENGILREEFAEDSSKPIIECSDLCSCKNCPNTLVQKGIRIQLQVFMTKHKGFGVQTTAFIPKLTFVCEYAGELIDKFEAQIRVKKSSPKEPNYIFVLNEYNSEFSNTCTIVDPTIYGNVGRYVNHSCSPNLIPIPIRANSMIPKICFFAKRDIMPNEELTYLYGRGTHPGKSSTHNTGVRIKVINKICHCNTEQCVGILPCDNNWIH